MQKDSTSSSTKQYRYNNALFQGSHKIENKIKNFEHFVATALKFVQV